jgi:hypothetical protein
LTLGLLSSDELADWAIRPFRAALEQGGFDPHSSARGPA